MSRQTRDAAEAALDSYDAEIEDLEQTVEELRREVADESKRRLALEDEVVELKEQLDCMYRGLEAAVKA